MDYSDVDKDAVKSALRKAFNTPGGSSDRLDHLMRKLAEADRTQSGSGRAEARH